MLDNKKFFIERIVIYCFFFLYFLMSQFFLPYVKKADVYPFFNWELFSDCDPYRSIPELEVSFVNYDGTRSLITNKRFTGKTHTRFYHKMQRMFKARRRKNKRQEDIALDILLSKVSNYIGKNEFEYKIFKSKVNLVEYSKKDSLEKKTLFRKGVFKK